MKRPLRWAVLAAAVLPFGLLALPWLLLAARWAERDRVVRHERPRVVR